VIAAGILLAGSVKPVGHAEALEDVGSEPLSGGAVRLRCHEDGDLRHQRALQGEDVERKRRVAPLLRIPGVGARGPFALAGTRRHRSRSAKRVRKTAIASRYQVGSGGIVKVASSASIARIASTSLRSHSM